MNIHLSIRNQIGKKYTFIKLLLNLLSMRHPLQLMFASSYRQNGCFGSNLSIMPISTNVEAFWLANKLPVVFPWCFTGFPFIRFLHEKLPVRELRETVR